MPYHKYDQVKFGNTINHFDKYRQEICAAAVIISRSWVDAQPEPCSDRISLFKSAQNDQVWNVKRFTALTNTEDKGVQ